MLHWTRWVACMAAVVGLTAVTAVPARADTMTWQFRSYSRYTVEVKLFSQNRRVAWPTATTSWLLRDFAVHKLPISCVAGEQICFGAAVQGSGSLTWGQGLSGRQTCQNCCYTCNEGAITKIVDLNER